MLADNPRDSQKKVSAFDLRSNESCSNACILLASVRSQRMCETRDIRNLFSRLVTITQALGPHIQDHLFDVIGSTLWKLVGRCLKICRSVSIRLIRTFSALTRLDT